MAGPDQRTALDWFDVEFANLRAGFRWAAERSDLATAAAIAAHATMLGWPLLRFEPVSWAEELLPAASGAELAQLPRLYVAASFCMYSGRPDDGVVYNQKAIALEADPRLDPFPKGWSRFWEGVGNLFAGRPEQALEIFGEQTRQSGPACVWGSCGQGQTLVVLGRREEVAAMAEASLAAARAAGNPVFVASALLNHALANELTDPVRTLRLSRQGLDFAREHRLAYWEANLAILAARLQAVAGDVDQSLRLYDSTIASLHQAGNLFELPVALLSLASTFYRLRRPEIATTLHGAAAHFGTPLRGSLATRLRAVLGDVEFQRHTAAGAAMELSDAVRYARHQIQLAR